MKTYLIPFLFALIFIFSCNTTTSQELNTPKFEKAYFASGCFWCAEAIFESLIGVKEVYNGYSGGHTENPTYVKSNTGRTGHAEAIEVIYNPEKISFTTLVDVYFGSQNTTQVNGQGPDIGTQYRSIIFHQTEEQKKIILNKKSSLEKLHKINIAAEIQEFKKFWIGEQYHQNYERQHPENRYIQAVSIPRLNRFKKKFPKLLKKEH